MDNVVWYHDIQRFFSPKKQWERIIWKRKKEDTYLLSTSDFLGLPHLESKKIMFNNYNNDNLIKLKDWGKQGDMRP